MSLGSRLRNARERKGWSQIYVAKKIGITNAVLSNYERDYRDPDTETLKKLADLYDTTTDKLLGREYTTPSNNHDYVRESEQEYALSLFMKITDPDKKKAAIEVLKGLAGEK